MLDVVVPADEDVGDLGVIQERLDRAEGEAVEDLGLEEYLLLVRGHEAADLAALLADHLADPLLRGLADLGVGPLHVAAGGLEVEEEPDLVVVALLEELPDLLGDAPAQSAELRAGGHPRLPVEPEIEPEAGEFQLVMLQAVGMMTKIGMTGGEMVPPTMTSTQDTATGVIRATSRPLARVPIAAVRIWIATDFVERVYPFEVTRSQ